MHSRPWRASTWLTLYPALAVATLLIHGYHPFAEDGGLYVAGVEYTLDTSLFPHFTAFVTEHLRFSIFAPTLAAFIHLTHLSLRWALFLITFASLTLLFFAAHKLLRECISSEPAQLAGMALLAAWATLPIAGTSLLLVDPYLTARSISTPLTLLALAFALRRWDSPRPIITCLLMLIVAALFHPLMAAYGLALVICLRVVRLRHPPLIFLLLTLLTLFLGTLLNHLAPAESAPLIAAEYSRYYWFLSQWQWYERLGLFGPLLVLASLLLWSNPKDATAVHRRLLIHACLALGCIATLVALLCAHESSPTHLVARLQPLRVFLLIYAIMALLLGAILTQMLLASAQLSRSNWKLQTFSWIPPLTISLFAAVMFLVQRDTFPGSPHIELPGVTSHNPWVQAFLWARENTPRNALFALDAHYISAHHEDAQTFRAIAQRSALPDFSKDGGEASITPPLAPLWQQGYKAQLNLSNTPDPIRDGRLLPLGVTWILIDSTAPTHHTCPYNNGTVKICRLALAQ
jgi:hypothetical protein